MFPCNRCGQCCRNIRLTKIYSELDRGDGVCKYLTGNLCSIYDHRPLLCQVDRCYDLLFSQYMSREEYYKMNKAACLKLNEQEE